MPTTITPHIRDLLDRVHAEAAAIDDDVIARALQTAAERGGTSESDVADVLADAYIPIDDTNGQLLHTLAAARRSGRVVEFGTSMGVSTIYLAAALRPGEPPVVATEIDASKVERASRHLEEAGLRAHVDIRQGDAFDTLADFDEPISLLFLDGWKDLYLPMLTMLEPLLVDGAFVVADDTILFAQKCEPLVSYLPDPSSGYVVAALPLGDGMEIACRIAA